MSAEYLPEIERFQLWLDYGIQNRWVSPPFCNSHDSSFLTEAEVVELEESDDPCLFCVRLWDGTEEPPTWAT